MKACVQKIIAIISALSISACAQGVQNLADGSRAIMAQVGPLNSTQIEREAERNRIIANTPKLDVAIPIFDPGLDKTKKKEELWPELRRAEANRFSWKLKAELEKTGRFNAVRVTPNMKATSDLYVVGKIVESTGRKVEISFQVFDISGRDIIAAYRTAGIPIFSKFINSSAGSGRTFSEKTISHTVDYEFFKDVRNKGKDSYQPVFQKAAEYIVKLLDELNAGDIETLKNIADLRFAANLSNEAFSEHLATSDDGVISLNSMPSPENAMLVRTRALRVRDQLFVDKLQSDFQAFDQRFGETHIVWQEQTLDADRLRSEARSKAIGQAIGAAVMIGLAVAAADSVDSSVYDPAGNSLKAMLAVGAGVGAFSLIGSSIQSTEEAQMHTDLVNELGQSVDLEVEPQVVEFQEEQAELMGSSSEQFAQWRAFLKKIYKLEETPQRQL